jgi:hypothetical protein
MLNARGVFLVATVGCAGSRAIPPSGPASPIGAIALAPPTLPWVGCVTSWRPPSATRIDGLRPGPTRVTITFRRCDIPASIHDVTVTADEVTLVPLTTDCAIDSFAVTSLE